MEEIQASSEERKWTNKIILYILWIFADCQLKFKFVSQEGHPQASRPGQKDEEVIIISDPSNVVN